MLDIKNKVVGGVLLCVAFGSSALTLGRMRGVAIVGQPLDVLIQVQLDGDDAASSLCFDADVFHGDTRQDGGRVRVTTETAQQTQTAHVRIASQAVVDEPVVTIYLRAGCTQKTTRRYVLLADSPTELVAQVVVPPLVAVPVAPPPQPAVPAVPATTSGPMVPSPTVAASIQPSKPKPAPLPPLTPKAVVADKPERKAAPPKAVAPVPVASAPVAPPAEVKKVPSATAGQSRLKLDPVELLAERIATLETSTSSAQVDTATRDALRLQSLEGDLKSLLALAAKNETNLLDLQVRLQKAESERYANSLVYGLGALVLICLAAVAFLLGRRRSRGAVGDGWWQGSKDMPLRAVDQNDSLAAVLREHDPMPMAPASAAASSAPLPGSAAVKTVRVSPKAELVADSPLTQVDVSMLDMSESNFDQLMQSGVRHSAVRKVLPPEVKVPGVGLARVISSEELFDVRQQAEFFVSLGQTDQAVRILENRINEHGESSPMAYLDLLRIFHSLGLKTDFRQFRDDFSLLFNASIPDFAGFNDQGRGLEDYPELFGKIMAAWPTSHVLTLIEASVFRDPWNEKAERFDLKAFQDLLLLHGIAQQVMDAAVASMRSSAPANGFPGNKQPVGVPVEVDVDLDLDLTDPNPGASAFDPMVASPAATNAPVAYLGNLMDFDPSVLDGKQGLGGSVKG